MQNNLCRYSKITDKFKREFLLLQGRGCVWKKCLFCDYYEDVSKDAYETNKAVIDKVTGEFGVLDVINSGSVFEIDDDTLNYLYNKCIQLHIHTLWFEAHWIYHSRLDEMRKRFTGIDVKFRIGAETFDGELREGWQKGIPKDVTAKEMSEYYDGCCLLICIEGQAEQGILNDIELADKYFSYCSINIFVENSKQLKRDEKLVDWFEKQILPIYNQNSKFEILINNTDLGVG